MNNISIANTQVNRVCYTKCGSLKLIRLSAAVLINLVVISTFVNGVVFELMGALALVLLFLLSTNIKINKAERKCLNKDKKFFYVTIILLLSFLALQILINNFDFAQLVNLRGTTRCVYAVLLVWLCIRRYFFIGIGIHTIVPLLLLMNIAQLIYLKFNISAFDVFHGSWNYFGAIDLVVLPFVLRFDNKTNLFVKILFSAVSIFVAFFMGSRSLLALTLILFLGMLVIERQKKYRKVLLAASLCILFCFGILLFSDNQLLKRALSVFSDGKEDSYRQAIVLKAQQDFYGLPAIFRFFGIGTTDVIMSHITPVHNFIWELLLSYGYIGLALWIVFYGTMFVKILCSTNYYKWYMLLFFGCSLLLNWVQPFITSGFIYQFFLYYGCLWLYYAGERKGMAVRS